MEFTWRDSLPQTADAVVIGGGVNGASIAFYLTRLGAGRVVLLEKDAIASAQTGRSTSIVRQHYTNPETAHLALESLRVFERFEEEVGYSAGFVRTGFLVMVGAENVAALKGAIELQREVGVRTEFIDTNELQRLQPSLALDGLAGAAYEPDSGYADPKQTALAFARAAADRGAQVFTATPATAIRAEKGRVVGVETPHGAIATRVVVNVAGAWGARLLAPLGIDFPLEAVRAPVGEFHLPENFREAFVIAGDFTSGVYYRPTPTTVQIGLLEEREQPRVNPDALEEMPDRETLERYRRAAEARYPALRGMALARGWTCAYDVTPDWHPVLDRADEVEGLYLALGFSGHGFKFAPLTGRLMAELVLEGKCREFDLGFFRFSRFREGRPIQVGYEYSVLG